VDEDVYRECPSLLISTVDKFAQIVRNSDTTVLFGSPTARRHAPPDLIIQDELHLISGPLGSLTGLYESAIDCICSSSGWKAKVIGSTATIRRATEQVRNLFAREAFQFPPPVINRQNSCFAVEDNEAAGRLYVGVTTAGRSAKFALQAVCAELLQAAAGIKASDEERNPYTTLVAYFVATAGPQTGQGDRQFHPGLEPANPRVEMVLERQRVQTEPAYFSRGRRCARCGEEKTMPGCRNAKFTERRGGISGVRSTASPDRR